MFRRFAQPCGRSSASAAEWKADLRAEPHVARLVLRRLVGPLTLWDESKRPDFVKWEAQPTTGLVDGLAPTLEGYVPDACQLEPHRPLAASNGRAQTYGLTWL
jgi:hypothetical protein